MKAIFHLQEAEKNLEWAIRILRINGYHYQANELRNKHADIRRIREILEEEFSDQENRP